jgi:hypothetical protein
MALFEEQITDTLQTGALPIKYEGDEGPQDPRQEQMLAQLKEEYMAYVFEQKELGEPIMSFEEWYQMVYEASKMGVQAPQEDMTAEEVMMREPAAYGGIMDTESGRRMYGLGSFFKKITKPFKKIAKGAKKIFKSPLGKVGIAALLAGAPIGTGAWGSLGTGTKAGWFGKGSGIGAIRNMMSGSQLASDLGKTLFKQKDDPSKWSLAKLGIGAASILPFLGIGTKPEEDKMPEGFDQSGKFDFDYNKRIGDVKNLRTTQDIIDFNRKNRSTSDLIEDASVYDFAADGGRIGYADGDMVEEASIMEKIRPGGVDVVEKIKEGIMEGGRQGLDEAIWIEKIKDFIRKKRGDPREEFMPRRGYALGSKADFAMEDVMTGGVEDEIGGITGIMRRADLQRKGNIGQFYAAEGGSPKEGGIMDLGGMEKDYRNTGGFVELGAEEKADDVPARLSKNEFVMTADAVRGAGDGDIDLGAERMEDVMKELEEKGQEENMKMAGPDWYIKRIEHLMFLGFSYEEASRIAYDNDKYYEVIGSDPMARKEGASDMFEVSERLSEVV